MVTNAGLVAGYFLQKRQLDHARQYSVAPGADHIAPVSGVDVNGIAWTSSASNCHVVRITEDGCPYCQKDRPNYERVTQEALQSGCEVIEIAPRAGKLGLDARLGVVQLEFLDSELGPSVYPFATPQTVVLDRDWNVAFSRRGMFDEKTLAKSVDVIQRLAKRAER